MLKSIHPLLSQLNMSYNNSVENMNLFRCESDRRNIDSDIFDICDTCLSCKVKTNTLKEIISNMNHIDGVLLELRYIKKTSYISMLKETNITTLSSLRRILRQARTKVILNDQTNLLYKKHKRNLLIENILG